MPTNEKPIAGGKEAAAKKQPTDGELSDDQLDNVAGGAGSTQLNQKIGSNTGTGGHSGTGGLGGSKP